MALTILPYNDRGPTKSERKAEAFREAIGKGIELYGEHQKKKADEQEYQEQNQTYKQLTGRNLSHDPKIREKEVEYALRGEHELKKGEFKNQTKAQEMGDKLRGEEKSKKELMSFADKLEMNNPESPVHKTIADIYRTDLPMDQKSALVKSLSGVDPFKMQQQQRLQQDSVLKRYSSKIKELQDSIKTARYSDRPALQQQLKDLQDQRDDLLDMRAMEGIDEDEEEADIEAEEGPKTAFDPKSEKHRAVAKKLYEKYGDKEKVRKELSKKFKGL